MDRKTGIFIILGSVFVLLVLGSIFSNPGMFITGPGGKIDINNDCGIIEVKEGLFINDCFANALKGCIKSEILQVYPDKEVKIFVNKDSSFCSIEFRYKFSEENISIASCNLPTWGDTFSKMDGYKIYEICDKQNKMLFPFLTQN